MHRKSPAQPSLRKTINDRSECMCIHLWNNNDENIYAAALTSPFSSRRECAVDRWRTWSSWTWIQTPWRALLTTCTTSRVTWWDQRAAFIATSHTHTHAVISRAHAHGKKTKAHTHPETCQSTALSPPRIINDCSTGSSDCGCLK